MKKILGLDLGTNSIGWAVVEADIEKKEGRIEDVGSRIIPMSQDILGKFDSGVSISQTAERTGYRGVRRLYQRDNLRRDRLHRVLNILNFLPKHYKNAIDFEKRFGQFKNLKEGEKETKINYYINEEGKFQFIFMDSFKEMVNEFNKAGQNTKIPHDWTLYYLRKKALTQKISNEELAWVILNFNQKRGYYQLRGEEEEVKDGKIKSFEILKVKNLIDSGEFIKKTGDKLYDVYFENGWKYDKQVTKTENWLNKTKEFIVTTSTIKSGETKRTYKAVDSEKDWIAIKEKAQQDIEAFNTKNNTLGTATYIYQTLLKNPTQKIRGKLIKTIERKYYKEELEQILKTQIELNADLQNTNLYEACINELYQRNENHKNNIKKKDFFYLFVSDIIFYQRPLKSKKSTISGCQYEFRAYKRLNKETGKTEIAKDAIKGISKSHPLFQEFRLWQFLKNLKIHKKEDVVDGKTTVNKDVTCEFLNLEEDWANLFAFLSEKKEIESKQLIDYFYKEGIINKVEKGNYRWNYVEEKKYPCGDTRAQFITRLKKIKNFDIDRLKLNKAGDKLITDLWHIIYSVKDKNEYEKALGTFAIKNDINKDAFVDSFIKFKPFDNDYAAYSEKAIKKLLPLMRRGKYWSKGEVSEKVQERITEYMQRVNSISVDKKDNSFDNYLKDSIADSDIPIQVIKSFIPFKGKNPLTALNTYQACYAVYERHSEVSEIQRWESPEDIDKYLTNFKQHSLRNPIVEQVVTETLRTVRDIWAEHGDFNEIHVELGREMKNPADKRKKMSERVTANENTNHRIKEILTELMNDGVEAVKSYSPSQQEILKIYEEGVWNNPDSSFDKVSEDVVEKIRKNAKPTKADISKYKLWLEQGYISPYTGKIIPLHSLFTHNYEIEHIIPQSRYFDNSLGNKVICESEVNRAKSNKTAYEFIKEVGGSIIGEFPVLKLEDYDSHCNKYFKNSRAKLKNLLSEEIPDGFIERQMNDTRYISKLIKGLLSNVVRENNEREATSKNLIPVNGSITAKLKKDWGLNDKWNELIRPRFERLNKMTNSNDFGYWDYQKDRNGNNIGKQFFRISVPTEIEKGFTSKRIDHRHHALDALVIACTSRKHIQYLNSLSNEKEKYGLQPALLVKNKEGHYTKNFIKPWESFTYDVKHNLEHTIISFKQNLRVINKTNNKTLQWVKQADGSLKKQLKKQEGINWAVRKPLHKETVSGAVNIRDEKTVTFNTSLLDKLAEENLNEKFILLNKKLTKKIKQLKKAGLDNKKIMSFFKADDYKFEGESIKKVEVYFYKKATASRKDLSEIKTAKLVAAITDSGIRKIIGNHLKNYLDPEGKPKFDLAFSPEGIDDLNKNIIVLNNGKKHQPIYKVRIFEQGSKFAVGDKGVNTQKYVEAAKGTNLFFAIYETQNKKQETIRTYETIPFKEVLEHQKLRATLNKEERKITEEIPINAEKGNFLFYLSPNDLVYVPTEEEVENPNSVDFQNLTKEQIGRVYKMVSSTGNQCFFIKEEVAISIKNKYEFSSLNKMEKSIDELMIKSRCWKLKVNRLGKVISCKR